MKAELGKRLVADLLKWSPSTATREFPWLKTLVEYKYDHYQGYRPGSRFFVNFLAWLAQFKPHDRDVAYRFIKEHLIFFSQREINHLIGLTFPRLQRENRHAVGVELGMPLYSTWGNPQAERRVQELSIRTLYVGLSDGARTDILRRYNEGFISNEQIVAAPEISDGKWKKLCEKLALSLSANLQSEIHPTFERICLVDDFTASGTTLIRFEKGEWGGKIPTFIEDLKARLGRQVGNNVVIQIHHYIGTNKARETIQRALETYLLTFQTLKVVVTFSMIIDDRYVIDDMSPKDIVSLIREYYGSSCETNHTGKNIWFGYKQCGLPLVLEHNTPNNSIALLWAAGKLDENLHLMKPLFPRKQRHLDHGQSV